MCIRDRSYDTINYINFRQVYEMMDLNNAVSVLMKGVDLSLIHI